MSARHINEFNIFRRASDMNRTRNELKPKKVKKVKPVKPVKPPVGPPPWPPLDLPDPPETGWNIGADENPN